MSPAVVDKNNVCPVVQLQLSSRTTPNSKIVPSELSEIALLLALIPMTFDVAIASASAICRYRSRVVGQHRSIIN